MTAVVQTMREFLADLTGLVRQALRNLGILLFILAFWAGLIGFCLAVLYELFLAPPTPLRALTTSDLKWIVVWACFIGMTTGGKR